ncbi:ribosomal protein L1-like protein [Leucosporidium creatinivorum]|uniref:Ribosomal protein L1-like protein n=1 Tax=Leucosporidium creatinivorum TaxID=106004 RepID=A0A1Y2G2F5_9BASI|nr:ribosomal protein L1-like protein [Leucosporidium creatinivorum]
MSVRSLQSLRALAAQSSTVVPLVIRSFSSSPAASTSKLSPLNKTTLARQQRAARGAGKHSKAKEADTLPLAEAAKVLQAWSIATPNAAYEINITTKPSSSIQLNALRGRVFLPHSCASSTKSSLLVVFAQGPAAVQARAAGADIVGGEELVEQILSGELSPDKLITTPDLLSLFNRNPTLARTLGPKGLMPSVKRGTVATDIAQAVKEARGGLDWKGDSKGVVRAAIGRLHFTGDALQDNVHTLLASVSDIALGGSGVVNGVPARTKRPAITRVLLSSTQGPGIVLADV